MVHYGSVTAAGAAAANAAPLPTKVHDAPGVSYTSHGYYVTQVVNELLANPALGATPDEREGTLFAGGLKIYSNEEPALQVYAQKVAVDDIAAAGLPNVVAAFAVIDPRTGNVEALVGGPGTSGSEFDDATQGLRQPGSGFKLFSLIGALEQGYDVYDSVLAASPCPITFPGVAVDYGYNLQHPLNNDPGDPNGIVSLVEATALSINCAFLRLAHEVNLNKVIATARSMGVSDPTLNPQNPSLVIGTEAVRPIEMAAAYATVADGGIYHTPSFVARVVDQAGAVIYNGESAGRRVFSAEVADEAIVALRATVEWGTGTAANLPNAEAAGKTGTTSNSVDAWFNGVTPTLVASVWIGNPQGEVPMYIDGAEVFGAGTPTPNLARRDGVCAAAHALFEFSQPRPGAPAAGTLHRLASARSRRPPLARLCPADHDDHDDAHDDAQAKGREIPCFAASLLSTSARHYRGGTAYRAAGASRRASRGGHAAEVRRGRGNGPVTTAPELAALLALQDLDSHTDRERHRRAHLPERAELSEVQALMTQADAKRTEAAAVLAEVAGRQQIAGEGTENDRGPRRSGPHSPLRRHGDGYTRELQAMVSDLEGLRKRASELADRVLELMEESEPLAAAVAELDSTLAALAERGTEVSHELSRAEAEVDSVLAELVPQRQAAAEAVPASLLGAYERLRAKLGGVAVRASSVAAAMAAT